MSMYLSLNLHCCFLAVIISNFRPNRCMYQCMIYTGVNIFHTGILRTLLVILAGSRAHTFEEFSITTERAAEVLRLG